MSDGQLAMNTNLASPGLFFKDSNGDLVKTGPVHVGTTAPNATPASGGQAGNSKGELWLDTSGSDYTLKTWDGSAWREIVVTSAMIKDGAIVNADINASAAIAHTKLANITAGSVLLGNASNVPTATALSGDVTVSDAGVTAIGSGVIVDADIDASAAIAGTKISPDFGSQALSTTGLISANGKVSFPLGTAALPSLYPGTDTNTGIYSPGADQVAISTNGTGRLFVDASGNVGLGTSSPDATLHVVGGSTTGVDTAAIFRGGANATANSGVRLYLSASDTPTTRAAYIEAVTEADTNNHAFAIATNPALATPIERLRITSAGNVGIGTTSPDDLLHISAGANSAIRLGQAGGNFAYRLRANVTASVNGGFLIEDAVSGNDLYRVTSGASGSHIFLINDTEAMRINNARELLVGYTTDNGPYKLQVNSQIFATSATVATSDGRYKENVASLGGCLDLVKALRPVSFTWKPQEDITRLDDEGNKVLVREGHNFPDGTQVGFIAQEVQEVLTDKPWLSSVIKENVRPAVKDNDGNELAPEEQFYGIAEGNLIAVLTNALQEAVAQIETLTDRVAALEALLS